MYKTNRLNHDFQIAYFLAGSCHTPDAAYALLCDLHEERDNAIKGFLASQKRTQAKIIRAQRGLQSTDEADRLEAESDLEEIEAMRETTERNLAAAIAERATIEKCIARLQPLRKYAHLPDPEAHQAAQKEEWKLELITRAENFILTTGSIPPDHFNAMRMHPEFKETIAPALITIRQAVLSGDVNKALASVGQLATFDIPALLALENTTTETQ